MSRLLDWVRKLQRIVRVYDSEHQRLRKRLEESERKVAELTDISVDVPVHRKDVCHVILVGKYKNNDYVQVFALRPAAMEEVIDLVSHLKKWGEVAYVDEPFSMRGAFRRELHERSRK